MQSCAGKELIFSKYFGVIMTLQNPTGAVIATQLSVNEPAIAVKHPSFSLRLPLTISYPLLK
jgi:hypothetical protein